MTDIPKQWRIFRGDAPEHRNAEDEPLARLAQLPDPPPWRNFLHDPDHERGKNFRPEDEEIERINAALYLRRPLLITGAPGTGKTTLTYAVARELGLGGVLRWSITSRTTLQDGLYRYDAIARLQDKDEQRPPIGDYLSLGPLGSAFVATRHYPDAAGNALAKPCPRVLLIDEIDKSDIDLPNDLLHIFEEGRFEIPELKRLAKRQQDAGEPDAPEHIRLHDSDQTVPVVNGEVRCDTFPLVVMTSNGEREFPPAFLRRCLHLEMQAPRNTREDPKLTRIVEAHLGLGRDTAEKARIEKLIDAFLTHRGDGPGSQNPITKDLATDQLLNAVYLTLNGLDDITARKALIEALWKPLSET